MDFNADLPDQDARIDADQQGEWAAEARVEVGQVARIEALHALLAATDGYRTAVDTAHATGQVFRQADVAAFSEEVRLDDLVAAYIKAQANALAMAEAAQAMEPALSGPLEETPQAQALAQSMREAADAARAHLTGRIGELITLTAEQVASSMHMQAAAAARRAATAGWDEATEAFYTAFYAAKAACDDLADRQALQDALDAFEQISRPADITFMAAQETFRTAQSDAVALGILHFPGESIIGRLNDLATTVSGPVTATGVPPAPVETPSPESAAEAVLTEADLDEPTRQQLLAAIDLHEQVAARYLTATRNMADEDESYEMAILEATDVLRARLNSLLP